MALLIENKTFAKIGHMSFLSNLDNLRPTLKGDRGVALEYVVLCHNYLLSPEDNFKKVTDIQTDDLKWNLILKQW